MRVQLPPSALCNGVKVLQYNLKFYMKKIMFVCLGNICRSSLAETVLQKIIDDNDQSENFIIDSSGTSSAHAGGDPDLRMQKVALSKGFQMTHRAKQLKQSDLEKFDLIFAMDEKNYQDILRLADSPLIKKKVHMFREFDPQVSSSDSVPDPYYGGKEGFEDVFQIISRTSQNIFDKIMSKEL